MSLLLTDVIKYMLKCNDVASIIVLYIYIICIVYSINW